MSKRKKIYIGFIFSIIAFLIIFLIDKINRKEQLHSLESNLLVKELANLKLVDGTNNLKNISYDYLYLVYFNTECEICHEQMKEYKYIFNNEHKNIFVFVSDEKQNKIKQFVLEKKIKAKNIFFFQDSSNRISDKFMVTSTPQLFIFRKKKLIFMEKGFISRKKIIKIYD